MSCPMEFPESFVKIGLDDTRFFAVKGGMKMKIITSAEFELVISSKEKMVLIDFFADWCGPCKMLAPVLEQLASEYQDKLEIYKVNVDEESDLAMKFGVQSIPTLILFQDGTLVKQSVGFMSKDQLVSLLGL